MAMQKRHVSSGASAARRRHPKPKKIKNIWFLFALSIALICFLLLIVRPYHRMEQLTKRLISSHAPAGTKIGDLTISFPRSITLTGIEVPVRINRQARLLRVEKLSGTFSFLPLLKGMVDAEMNSDFFGGILWVKVQSKAVRGGDEAPPRSGLDARARGMDLSQLCKFAAAPVSATGKVDVDVEGDFERERPLSFIGKAFAIGKEVEIPQLETESITLPANKAAQVIARISVDKESVTIRSFDLTGTAYDLSGSGTIALKEPTEDSSLNCNLGVLFKERFAITDRRIQASTADTIVEAIVNNKSKLPFKISGTVAAPEINIDPASSLAPFLKYLNK